MTSESLLLRRSVAVFSSSAGAAAEGATGAARSESSSLAASPALRLASAASASRFFFPCTFLSLSSASTVSIGCLYERHTDAPEELFTVHLVKLTHDILNCIVETRNDDVLDGVHAAVRCANNLIENHECRLK